MTPLNPQLSQRGGMQGVLGWTTLSVVLLFSLFLGANRPVSWVSLTFLIFVLFMAQLYLDYHTEGIEGVMRYVALPTVLWLAVLSWAWVQTTTWTPAAWSHPAWLAVSAEAGRVAIDPLAGEHHLMRLLSYTMVFWIILRSSIAMTRSSDFMSLIAVYSALLAIYGLYSTYLDNNFILGDEQRYEGTSATFVNRNSYVLYAGFGLLANLAALSISFHSTMPRAEITGRLRLLLNQLTSARTAIFGLGALLCAGAIATTASRAGIMSVLASVVAFYVVKHRQSSWLAVYKVPLYVLILAVFAALTFGDFFQRTASFLNSGHDGRYFAILATVEAISDRPWLGHGLGGFTDGFRAYAPLELSHRVWTKAHSTYVETAFELGLPAALLFYTALGIIGWRCFRGARAKHHAVELPAFAFACFIGALLHSTVDFSLQIPATATLFAAILGIGYSNSFAGERLG